MSLAQMTRFLKWCVPIAVISTVLSIAATLTAQTPTAPSPTKAPSDAAAPNPADYSAEPFVIESTVTSVDFQNDGTSVAKSAIRVKVQSQAALQAFGLISRGYPSATSTLHFDYVRAIKPDGEVIQTPTENMLDMPAQITQQAPFYSDLKVQQVAVKGLAIGDTLDFAYTETETKPFDPGQFWFDYNFFKEGVVLDEQLVLSFPQGKYVKVQSPDVQPTTQQKDGRIIYSWKTSQLKGTGGKKDAAADSGDEHTAVMVTTFKNWGELGAWVNSLTASQAAPTADIKAKAAELTRDAKSDQEKIQILYNFVSTKYRYIAIDFGIGRYQPHTATEVLNNDYGDCKDKHTLFAALLAAVGIKSYPALMNTGLKVDPDVPSPMQFDHVITAIPQGSGYLFLDTTPEVAPYGYLIAELRDKKALVVPDNTGAALVQTPADAPFSMYFNFKADGSLDNAGTLESKMQMTMQGDIGVAFRLALNQVGKSQWDQAVQVITRSLGFGGTVSETAILSLDSISSPLNIDYSYERKNYSDWDNKRIGPPFPPLDIVAAPDESEKNPKPVKIGSLQTEDLQATVKLPDKANPQLPSAVSLHQPFADYEATYSVSGGALHAERKLTVKAHEVTVDQIPEYRKFVKGVLDDESTFIPIFAAAPSPWRSTNQDAQALYDKALQASRNNDRMGAIKDYKDAVAKDPTFAAAWLQLGYLDYVPQAPEAGISELKKAGTVDLSNLTISRQAAQTLSNFRRRDDALEVLKSIEAKNPDDFDTHSQIATILTSESRWNEAIPEIQEMARIKPDDNPTLLRLGNAYFGAGDANKGADAFTKVLAADRSAPTLNIIASTYADNDLNLNDALKYSQEALKDIEERTRKIQIDKVDADDFQTAPQLAAYWDSFGWVEFKRGQYALAEEYLNASWNLTQSANVADHLGQTYEKEGKTREAITAYNRATFTIAGATHARERLSALRSTIPGGVGMTQIAVSVQDVRTFKMPRIYSGSASAKFRILFAPGKPAEAKFVDGSEDLQAKGEAAIKAFDFKIPFPHDSQAEILRTGLFDCETAVPQCMLVLVPPDSLPANN